MANTSAPPPPPKSSNAPFIIAAILMLLLMGGLVVWKLGGNDEEKQKTSFQPVAPSATETVPDQIIPPPPPPPSSAEPDAGAPAASAKKPSSGAGIGTGCPSCGHCTGEAAPSFAAVLRARANQAQRCYEKALAQQEQLQGKLTVNLCVGVGGAVCGASISNDSLGSPLVSQCVANIYRATTFPSPKNGCVDAQVPLNFVPQKQ